MTNEEIIEQLENTIGLIKQNGKDWLDDRDIPILEACIKSLTVLDKIKAEIEEKGFNSPLMNPIFTMTEIMGIIDKYSGEQNE